jgi:hypothetical protein
MRYVNSFTLMGAVVAAVAAVPVRAAPPIEPARFEQLHALIKPSAVEEKWAQIPWLASLWEARQRAAREGKPILLWEMDGHPLGCV